MHRDEFQVKFEMDVSLPYLVRHGAEHIGHVVQKDTYLDTNDKVTLRIREEAGHYILTRKKSGEGTFARLKKVLSEEAIGRKEFDALMKAHDVYATVYKERSLFRLEDVLITVDRVERLGNFIELRAKNERSLKKAIDLLGFSGGKIVRKTYVKLLHAKDVPRWLHGLARLHERIGELTFGITSGTLTTIGVLVAVHTATTSKLAVVASIASIAIADSTSDSFGMYLSKKAERGVNPGEALRFALSTFIGKFIFPLTFIIPILILPLSDAVVIDIIWGLCVLLILSVEQALVSGGSIMQTIFRNITLGIAIIIFSYITGTIIQNVT